MPFLQSSNRTINSCRNFKCSLAAKPFLFCILVATLATWSTADAWKQCLSDEGGGFCPEGNTCCPTEIPGLSSCIPGREKDPKGARGQCCDANGRTGCPYGYDCTKGNLCKRREPHPESLNAKETPRYELCRLPPSDVPKTYDLQKFPIDGFHAVYYSSMGSILPQDNPNDNQKFASIETVVVIVHGSGRNADDYLCAGMSTATLNKTTNSTDYKSQTEQGRVLVIAPKFVADIDYDDRNRYENTLYWLDHGKMVPLGHTWRYGADAANTNWAATANVSTSDNGNTRNRFQAEDDTDGSYKNNQSGISSYAVMDRLLEFLIGSKQGHNETRSLRQSRQDKKEFYFPRLKRIVVAGHSAGGQYVHRWSLLSSSPVIWGDGKDFVHSHNRVTAKDRRMELRMIVANPRSYCYPDNRRMIRTDNSLTSESNRHDKDDIVMDVESKIQKAAQFYSTSETRIDKQYTYTFAVPDPRDIDACPTYDQWQWGLEPGGDILCPYKDAALALLENNRTELAVRYSKRKVFYLAGEYDTIQQEDRCETYSFQGDHRNERARRYFRALTAYFESIGETWSSSLPMSTNNKSIHHVHEFHQVPGSPHDHTLMFQSMPGREAFYGNNTRGCNHEKLGSDILLRMTSDNRSKESSDTNLEIA